MKEIKLPNASTTFKQARQLLQTGQFKQAHTMYQKLGSTYGTELVRANLYLCEKHLSDGRSVQIKLPNALTQAQNKSALPSVELAEDKTIRLQSAVSQLEKTQALLEEYYIEAQQLKYKQMDVPL